VSNSFYFLLEATFDVATNTQKIKVSDN